MSEGEHHSRLVAALLEAMRSEFSESISTIYCDSPLDGRFLRPRLIGAIRPDIHLQCTCPPLTIVGEAKSARDVDNLHTRSQLKEMLEHLTTVQEGLLWLAVPLAESGAAFRVANEVRRQLRADHVRFRVSGWLLGPNNYERRWHG